MLPKLATVAVGLLLAGSVGFVAASAHATVPDGRYYYKSGGKNVDVYVSCQTGLLVAQVWKGKLSGTNASYANGATEDELAANMVFLGVDLPAEARAALDQDVALGLCVE